MQKGRTKIWFVLFFVQLMRNVGLEPTRLAAQEPKSCMSANSISSAIRPDGIRTRQDYILAALKLQPLFQLQCLSYSMPSGFS